MSFSLNDSSHIFKLVLVSKDTRNLFKLTGVGGLFAPLQRGHLHMVLITLMLHQKRPDE